MKIRYLATVSTPLAQYDPGDIRDVESGEARQLIAAGTAEAVAMRAAAPAPAASKPKKKGGK